MDFILQRYSNVAVNGGSTQGVLMEKTANGLVFFSHTLEDEGRAIKVPGETRIWAGFYELKILKLDNDWTKRHREKYGKWFVFPIEITNVKEFAGILIHAGIDQSHTEGCVLLDDTIGNNSIDIANQGARSLPAVQRFYEKVYPYLDKGGKCFLTIRDENFLIGNT